MFDFQQKHSVDTVKQQRRSSKIKRGHLVPSFPFCIPYFRLLTRLQAFNEGFHFSTDLLLHSLTHWQKGTFIEILLSNWTILPKFKKIVHFAKLKDTLQ